MTNNISELNSKGISIIIVLYNSEKYILECLRSILQFSYEFEFEVILIDNHSQDNTLNVIAELEYPVKIIRNEVNYGFSKAVNQGIKLAKYDFLFLLNPDTFLINDALNIFIRFMNQYENKFVWCVGGQIFNQNNLVGKSSGRFPTILDVTAEQIGLKGLLLKVLKDSISYNRKKFSKNTKVQYVVGCNMFIRKNCLTHIGLFNEKFFLNFEETELAWRAKKANFSCMILPEVKIIHYANKSFNSKINYMIHFWNGQILYFKLTKAPVIFFIAKSLHLLGVFLRVYIKKEFRFNSRFKYLREL